MQIHFHSASARFGALLDTGAPETIPTGIYADSASRLALFG
jgi:hypothetical protein